MITNGNKKTLPLRMGSSVAQRQRTYRIFTNEIRKVEVFMQVAAFRSIETNDGKIIPVDFMEEIKKIIERK